MATTKLTRDQFPDAGPLRIWVVSPNPKSVTTPVTIELREYANEEEKRRLEARGDSASVSFTRKLGLIYTTAKREDLLKAADTLLDRVGDIDNVVGVY